MVRLEKIIYEKAINGLNRSTGLGAPTKWFNANPYQHLRLNYHNFMNKTIVGRLWKPIVKWFNIFEMRIHLDLFRQQGLAPEDRLLHLDKHLRRNVLFEHVARETLHPYHWLLKSRRRERFCRIDFAYSGFWVPDHVNSESATQTYYDYLKVQKEWADHLHNNYFSDMTPQARRSAVPKVNPIELLQNFGVLKHDAWDRYFMNEKDEHWFTEQETKVVRDRKTFPYNLTTAAGKRDFEEYVNDFNEKVPGALAPVGQKFDFKSYYAELGV